MASFCSKCGAALNDGVAFCPGCGAPVGQQVASNQAPLNPTPVAPAAPAKAPKVKAPRVKPVSAHAPTATKANDPIQSFIDKVKLNPKSMAVPFGIIAGVLLVAIILLSILGSTYGSGSIKGAIETQLKAMTGNEAAFKKCQPKFYWDYLKEEDDLSSKELKEYIEDSCEFLEEAYEDRYGKNVKISDISIKDKDKLDKDDIEELEEYYEDQYDKKVNISAAYEVEGKYKIKGKDESERSEFTFIVVKINGRWYVQ